MDNIDIRHFIRMFFDFAIYQKFKGGTLIKCLISILSNLSTRFGREPFKCIDSEVAAAEEYTGLFEVVPNSVTR